MVIYLPVIITPESVHVGVQEHNDEGVQEIEQEPGINHLHVGGLRQAVTHIDEHRCKHQHRGEVHSYDSLENHINTLKILAIETYLKEEGFEEVGRITDDVQ